MKLDLKLEKINFQYYIVIKNNIYINISESKYIEINKIMEESEIKNKTRKKEVNDDKGL